MSDRCSAATSAKDLCACASKGAGVDWGHLHSQIAAIGEAVADGSRVAADDARRAERSLDRLAAVERLLAAGASSAGQAPPGADTLVDAPGEAADGEIAARARPARPQRASLHRSPLVDLFRDTEPAHRRD